MGGLGKSWQASASHVTGACMFEPALTLHANAPAPQMEKQLLEQTLQQVLEQPVPPAAPSGNTASSAGSVQAPGSPQEQQQQEGAASAQVWRLNAPFPFAVRRLALLVS